MDPEMIAQMPQANPTPVGDGKPYFLGDHALVKFAGGEGGFGPEVYWLVDKESHTIRPFESHMALDAAFGDELEAALSNTVTVNSPQVDENGEINDGVLADFCLLGPEYAIREDGTSKPLRFSTHQLKGRYGKQVDESLEGLAAEAVDGFLGLMKTNEKETGIPSTFLNTLKNDQRLMAFYISAMAYGEYNLGDIYADISERFEEEND